MSKPLCVFFVNFLGMKPKSEKLECKLFAKNNTALGINMNIVSNVGQMFMFCVGSLLHHFWRCVWLLQGKGFCT